METIQYTSIVIFLEMSFYFLFLRRPIHYKIYDQKAFFNCGKFKFFTFVKEMPLNTQVHNDTPVLSPQIITGFINQLFRSSLY